MKNWLASSKVLHLSLKLYFKQHYWQEGLLDNNFFYKYMFGIM